MYNIILFGKLFAGGKIAWTNVTDVHHNIADRYVCFVENGYSVRVHYRKADLLTITRTP